MPATISESYLSRPFTLARFNQGGRELVYDILGTDDEEEVESLLLATAPAVYLGRVLESVSGDPQGNGVWKGHARYVQFEDGSEYTFDTGGGTQKITQSITTINSYAPGGFTPPNFQGAIGVTEDRIEGTDITSPVFTFSETHQFDDATVTTAYKVLLFNLTGRVNDAPFKGLAAGECLFLGASGSKRGNELWSLSFRFAGSPNATGMTIGSITGIDKKGWEYLWIRYADFEDTSAFALVKRPIACYVESVYLEDDFSQLLIGI